MKLQCHRNTESFTASTHPSPISESHLIPSLPHRSSPSLPRRRQRLGCQFSVSSSSSAPSSFASTPDRRGSAGRRSPRLLPRELSKSSTFSPK
ncbi:hypothetical protein PIB30_002442 [Stylosanthes scabra]|uniref:Uncharacterized protein n=1 Tax=Stylosanthes scabra TaxID=79078 RepID=A0ABU6W150_9FABA|nr:hypothetical protein [Stylosanthes scabra]